MPLAQDVRHLLDLGSSLAGSGREALRWAANRSGVPSVVIAAVMLVAWWHLFRRSVRWTVEVAFALALLLAATRLGWISW
jgi:hypothetical protein